MIQIQKFIASFFCQILYMSIVATIVGLVALLIRKLTNRKISPRSNYMIWLVFIIALIFPVSTPSKISIYNFIDISSVKNIENENVSTMPRLIRKMGDDKTFSLGYQAMENYKNTTKEKLLYIIADIWFVIFLIKLSGVVYSYNFWINGLGNEIVEDKRVNEILERCKKKLKINKNIKIIRQDIVKAPSIIGVFRVNILLADYALELDDDVLTDIFMHELAHHKRNDNFLNIVIMVLKSIYYFNPIIIKLFENIKTDMEFATDELAIRNIENLELLDYCKVVIDIAGKCSSKIEPSLGFSDEAKAIDKRIDMIFLKERFDKYSLPIAIGTICLILMMWLVLYPTSYGMFATPKLYFELENGDKVEIKNIDENCETIKIAKSDKIKLLTEGAKCEEDILYNKTNLREKGKLTSIREITNGKIQETETGAWNYKFVVKYGNNKSAQYAVNIIVVE